MSFLRTMFSHNLSFKRCEYTLVITKFVTLHSLTSRGSGLHSVNTGSMSQETEKR